MRAVAKEFLLPFLLLSSGSALLVSLLDLQISFSLQHYALITAFFLFCASALTWYFFHAKSQLRLRIYEVVTLTFTPLLAAAIVWSFFPTDLYERYASFALIFLMSLCVIQFAPFTRAAEMASPDKPIHYGKSLYTALTILIITFGVSLCAYKAYSVPTISVDEAHSSISASSILSRGLPYFPNTEVAYSRSWVNLYTIAASYSLFGFSEFSARIPSVLAYAGTIILFFLTIRRFASKTITLGALLLFATNPWILFYGSYARMYIFILLFSALFAYLLTRYLETKSKNILYVGFPLTIVLGLLSERTFLLFVPPYALLVLFSLPHTRAFWKKITLFGILPAAALGVVALSFWFARISAFISRYIIGFNNGANPLENAQLQYIPLEWLSHFGLPTVLLLIASVLIILRGGLNARIVLAIFWLGELLIDTLIYSNFPARRFNYTFILVELYALILVWGVVILTQNVKIVYRAVFILVVMGSGLYVTLFSPPFPTYADFSRIQEVPVGSVILGYPTSPLVFYNIKYDRHAVIRPFITDTIEMAKYTQNGTEIYSGGPYVTGVRGLNELRQKQDVYLFFEKTRVDFLNDRTNEYIYTTCTPIDADVASSTQALMLNNYRPFSTDYDTRDTMLILTCPKIAS